MLKQMLSWDGPAAVISSVYSGSGAAAAISVLEDRYKPNMEVRHSK